jgi:predicted RecA/RadA family phage recombinase
MKNYIQSGNVLTLAAPYDRTSGQAMKVGSIIAVATGTVVSGSLVEAAVVGVFEHAKNSAEAWTVGARVYWDDTNKVFTTTSSGNTLAGVAVAAAANPSSTGVVRLNGSF